MNRYGVSWTDSETRQIFQAHAESEELMDYLEAKLYQKKLIVASGELTSPKHGFGIMMYYLHPQFQLLTAQPRKNHPYIHVVITSGIVSRQTLCGGGFKVGKHSDPTPDVTLYRKEEIDRLLHTLEENLNLEKHTPKFRKFAYEISEAFVDENLDQLVSYLKSGNHSTYLSYLQEIRYTKWFEAWLKDPEIHSLMAHLTELDLHFRNAYRRIAPLKHETFASHITDPLLKEMLLLRQRLSYLFSREYLYADESMTELQRLEEMHEIIKRLKELQKRHDEQSQRQKQNH